jgi:hypothetical protein
LATLKKQGNPIHTIGHRTIKMWAIWRGLGKLTEYKSILATERKVLSAMQQGKTSQKCVNLLLSRFPKNK